VSAAKYRRFYCYECDPDTVNRRAAERAADGDEPELVHEARYEVLVLVGETMGGWFDDGDEAGFSRMPEKGDVSCPFSCPRCGGEFVAERETVSVTSLERTS
jgi:hypothetical protein